MFRTRPKRIYFLPARPKNRIRTTRWRPSPPRNCRNCGTPVTERETMNAHNAPYCNPRRETDSPGGQAPCALAARCSIAAILACCSLVK